MKAVGYELQRKTRPRDKVRFATKQAAGRRPNGEILTSPWSSPELTECGIDPNPAIDVPEGIVVSTDGHTHP